MNAMAQQPTRYWIQPLLSPLRNLHLKALAGVLPVYLLYLVSFRAPLRPAPQSDRVYQGFEPLIVIQKLVFAATHDIEFLNLFLAFILSIRPDS